MAPMSEKAERKLVERDQSIRCECHQPLVGYTTRTAVLKLAIAAIVALLFMMGEVLGESEAQMILANWAEYYNLLKAKNNCS